MIRHLSTGMTALRQGLLDPYYVEYLERWRDEVLAKAEHGDIAASDCLQGAMIDIVLNGRVVNAWVEIMDEELTVHGRPVAYSLEYSKRLHQFNEQYLQTTIHAIHSRWWVLVSSGRNVDHGLYWQLLSAKRTTDGLFYDHDVSETILRHRMQTELTLSAAMAIEVALAAGALSPALSNDIATTIACPRKVPTLGYLSMEYFRQRVLHSLQLVNLMPAGVASWIHNCEANLEHGWCDFPIAAKLDPYMGTRKRTSRDRPIHSPMIACYVRVLLTCIDDPAARARVEDRLSNYGAFLAQSPSSIPAFQMRDVVIPFGLGLTPIEAICSSEISAPWR